MSQASFAFASWVRRGVSTAIQIADEPGASTGRATVPITVEVNDSLEADAPLSLVGPGDIVGFDERCVIRRWPARASTEAESNLFPLVELDQPDLPWRYTPARASSKDRLRPWLCLVVLADDEIMAYESPRGDRQLAAVTIRAGAPLPRLDQTWAWAHVQVSGTLVGDAGAIDDALAQRPHAVLSRLVCPRQLRPNRAYTAMLVPTFEHGRRAGLRLALTGIDNALAPAWTGTAGPATLPVYHAWRFSTGAAGDFESLVKRLAPRRLPDSVGVRDLDVSRPGAGLPPAASHRLGVRGALQAPTARPTPWADSERSHFVDALEDLLDLPAEMRDHGGRALVAPPLYGGWHALEERLRDAPTAPWFELVNSDPQYRVAAGLGTQVVQANDRILVASAWEQGGEIREINDQLRHAQLGREVSARLHARLFDDTPRDDAITIARPLHARVKASPTTIQAVLDESPIPTGLLDGALRRIARPTGPIARRESPTTHAAQSMLRRANAGDIQAAPPPTTSSALPTHEQIAGVSEADRAAVGRRRRLALGLGIGIVLLTAVAVLGLVAGAMTIVVAAAALATVSAAAAATLVRRAAELDHRVTIASGKVPAAVIASAPARPDFVARDPVLPAPPPATPSAGDSASAKAFREAAQALAREIVEEPLPAARLHSANLDDIHATLKTALDPRVTITRAVRDRLRFPGGVVWPHPDVLEPVIPGPEFPQPMYKPLAELSPEWIVPGLDKIPADTVSLALTNPPFIEAFMLGLNHEMSRELVWNEYPTSQRKTYFRQFWDPAGHVRTTAEPTEDIHPIHEWPANGRLGENSPRSTPAGGQHLVVLVRGEVFRRYPNTVVTAVKAKLAGNLRTTGDEEFTPVFGGRLEPDLAFFGFDLTQDQARGSDGGQGWYIVLQEPLSEPRFGLDVSEEAITTPPASWSDLSWGHLVGAGDDPASIEYIDLDADHPVTTAVTLADARWHADAGIGPKGALAADLAYITVQQPMRVAVHAVDMLPPKEQP